MDDDIRVIEKNEIKQSQLPNGARKVAEWAELAGFEVRQSKSVVQHPPVLYVSSSDTHAMGEVRTPAKEKTHYWLQAMLKQGDKKIALFSAHWVENSFSDVFTYDVVGTPTELYFDYGNPKQTHLYNDATYYTKHQNMLSKDGDFKTWLADWAGILGIEPLTVRKQKAPKMDPYSNDIDILNSLEWQA